MSIEKDLLQQWVDWYEKQSAQGRMYPSEAPPYLETLECTNGVDEPADSEYWAMRELEESGAYSEPDSWDRIS